MESLLDLIDSSPRVSISQPVSGGGWDEQVNSGTPWRNRACKRPRQQKHSPGSSQSSGERSQDMSAERASPTRTTEVNSGNPSGSRKKARMSVNEKDVRGLSDEQRKIIDYIIDGHSLFFTGPAGSGKSFLLSKIVSILQNNGRKHATFVTGTTGIAACNIGGITVNSFAGIGLGNDSLEKMTERVMGSLQAKKRWKQCHILIIDEISMMDGALFDKLCFIGSRVRDDPRPFGGLQLILCGDFFQLPPVGISSSAVKFCFEANRWNDTIAKCFCLTRSFRQKENRFISILNEVRLGKLSQESHEALQRCAMQKDTLKTASEGSTRLFARNADVDSFNQSKLGALEGQQTAYEALDNGDVSGLNVLQKNCPAPSTLSLKVGAEVMLLKNIDVERGLVNGTRGVIIDFCRVDEWSEWPALPKVRFTEKTIKGTVRHSTHVIEPAHWDIEVGGRIISTRVQVPLRLAWAISIHKSQGMTISNLEVNLAGLFEYGQAYVALSRATDLDTLHISGFSTKSIRTHHRVKAFYEKLASNHPDGTSHGNKENGPAERESLDGWISRRPIQSPAAQCDPLDSDFGSVRHMSTGHSNQSNHATSQRVPLSEAQRERIKKNRDRALAIRDQRRMVERKPPFPSLSDD